MPQRSGTFQLRRDTTNVPVAGYDHVHDLLDMTLWVATPQQTDPDGTRRTVKVGSEGQLQVDVLTLPQLPTPSVTYLAASGSVKATPGTVVGIILTAGTEPATLTLRNGGDTGAILAVIKAASGATQAVSISYPLPFSTSLYAELTGAGAGATILYF